jgi:hypothetical protein
MDSELKGWPVCPYCGKEWNPNDLDAGNEYGYITGVQTCHVGDHGCGKKFNVETHTLYETNKLEKENTNGSH